MGYKKGDIVKIKSISWWEKQPKFDDDLGRLKNLKKILHFPKQMALDCCGSNVMIIDAHLESRDYNYKIRTSSRDVWWICKDWIEREVGTVINLKLIKNEI